MDQWYCASSKVAVSRSFGSTISSGIYRVSRRGPSRDLERMASICASISGKSGFQCHTIARAIRARASASFFWLGATFFEGQSPASVGAVGTQVPGLALILGPGVHASAPVTAAV